MLKYPTIMYLIEGSPIIKIASAQLDIFPEARDISNELQGKVAVIPRGSSLYHCSKSLRDLLNRGMFDQRLSRSEGAFYFTDFPAIHTNCQIVVREKLIVYNFNQISDEELKRMELAGNGNGWVGAMNMGFDGRVFQNPDPYTEIEDGIYATEIVVFATSLNKLGKIIAFPLGSERHLYRF